MKKTTAAAAALLLALLVAGCKEKESKVVQETVTAEPEREVETVPVIEEPTKVIGTADGIMIYGGWGFCTEKEGKMVAAEWSSVGDSVQIVTEDGAPVEKMATQRYANGTEESFNFVKVDAEGKEYWTRTTFVSRTGRTGVILEDGYLFSAPDMATMTQSKVKTGQLVVTYDATDDFAAIVTYSKSSPYGKDLYILKNMISIDDFTIDSMITQARLKEYSEKTNPAEQLKDVVRNEILELVGSER